jgi:hypothetical protein
MPEFWRASREFWRVSRGLLHTSQGRSKTRPVGYWRSADARLGSGSDRQHFDNIDSFSRGHLSCLEAYSDSRSAAIFASFSRSHLDL